MRVTFDIEADGLLDTVSRIWCVVCIDIDTGTVYSFGGPDMTAWVGDFLQFAQGVTLWIGHNVIGYDLPCLERFMGLVIPIDDVVDTLVLSRLVKAQRNEGHSLEAWGKYLRYPKLEFADFHVYSDDLLKRCINDVKLNLLVYQHLMRWFKNEDVWSQAVRTEQYLAKVCQQMSEDGFSFNYNRAVEMHKEVVITLKDLTDSLQKDFPPRAKFLGLRKPKVKKDGTISLVGLKGFINPTDFTPDAAFSMVEWIPFTPGSPRQVVTRLNELGWAPEEKTKGYLKLQQEIKMQRRSPTKEQSVKLKHYEQYGWKVNETNLSTLPWDAPDSAKNLVRWLLLDSRRSTLEEWMQAYNPNTGSIHGNFTGIGSWTHRMAHSAPNMANIPAVKADRFKDEELKRTTLWYGKEMRSLWKVEHDDEWLIGCDAEGIQLRVLAHYINDPTLIQAIASGNKDDGTDPHTLNMRALGNVCRSRDNSKTFLYAFLLGAGIGKIAQIFGCSHKLAKQARDNFVEAYPGLKHIKDVLIPEDAQRGYFKGLDGRLVMCDSEHLMLAGYLQNGEKIIMANALAQWNSEARVAGIDYTIRNFVHDEWQSTTRGTEEQANALGRIQANSFAIVGERLGLNCPLAGVYNVGKTWYDTH